MIRSAVPFVALLALALPCEAAEPVIVGPSWKALPGPKRVKEAYPDRAYKERLAGKVQLDCLITTDGWAADCQVLSETPQGYGFGGAAIRLVTANQLNPGTVDGVPTAMRRKVPFSFTPPP